MMPTILLFAAAREAAGCTRVICEGLSVSAVLREVVSLTNTDLERLIPYCAVMVDGVLMNGEDALLRNDAEVALLPPVSGGAR